MNTSSNRAFVLGAALSVLGLVASAQASDASTLIKPTPDKKGYTIDYEALGKAPDLDEIQKRQVAWALRRGQGHYADQKVEDIAGLSGSCTVKKDFGFPVQADCTLTADPAATKVLSQLGTFALTSAICLIVDAADLEVTSLICEAVLEPVAAVTLEPALESCADNGYSTSISIGLNILPRPGIDHLNASCQ